CFKETMGSLPDFLDGHQHVHQLPQIRQILIKIYQKYFKNKQCYIRAPQSHSNWRDILLGEKKILINLLGAKALKRLLEINQIAHPLSFSGVYNFDKSQHYSHYFKQFLNEIADQGLILCHPGKTT